MRRIRDDRENETMENAIEAFDRYADGKHKRREVKEYEKNLEANLSLVLNDIIKAIRKKSYSRKRQGNLPRLQ